MWEARLDAPAEPRLESTLSADERARGDRFLLPRDGHRFRRGRALLRAILGEYLDEDPARLRIECGGHGKPRLAGGRCQFNLSHSHDVMLVAVAAACVGVDVERIRPLADPERVAERFFSDAERSALASVSPRRRPEAFFRCWTRKEAFVKATGRGLSVPLRAFDVGLDETQGRARLDVRGHDEGGRWSLWGLPAAPGHCAALVAEVPIERVRHGRWAERSFRSKRSL
ncbi:MAG: 4'-phosphopantetheinyl transferase [Acidobacteria bacterium]|nr:MAG: 4'-phosphopantetheinyl transferase [Acidobacteriota bacterium]